jgi:hypothetical protein
MAAGFMNRNEIDQRALRVVLMFRDAINEAAAFNATLQDTTMLGRSDPNNDATDLLMAAGGYTKAEADQLRNGMFALALGGMVMHGQAAQPGAVVSDFFFDAKHLAGARW